MGSLVLAIAVCVVALVLWRRRRYWKVAALQPERLALLRRESAALGLVPDGLGLMLEAPGGPTFLHVVDPRDLQDPEPYVALDAPRAMSAFAYVDMVASTPDVPFELALYKRDLLMRQRGLERSLSRRFRRTYYASANGPSSNAALAWLIANEATLLRLRPSRVYVHRSGGPPPRVEIILDLSTLAPGHLGTSLELIAQSSKKL
ncbi:MAG: hypothetical protein U0271_43445 [Polyangiaceae bacterium]